MFGWLQVGREAWWFGWKLGWVMGVVHPTGAVRGAGPRGGGEGKKDYVSIGRRRDGSREGRGWVRLARDLSQIPEERSWVVGFWRLVLQ